VLWSAPPRRWSGRQPGYRAPPLGWLCLIFATLSLLSMFAGVPRSFRRLERDVRQAAWNRLVTPLTGGHRWRTHTVEFAAGTGVVSAATVTVAAWMGAPMSPWTAVWVGPAAVVGCVAHLLGDWPTLAGIPWTLRACRARRVYALGWLRVGSAREVAVTCCLWPAAGWLLLG
jgi:membrane-bound metal-dependent hydrolase YbcI (DUF457 family)